MSDEKMLSVIIPTRGRASLTRTLASIWNDASTDDVEIIISVDTHGPLLEDVDAIAKEWEAKVIRHDAGHHCWGHCQINKAMEEASGAYLAFIDDDDEFVDGGITTILDAIELMQLPLAPIMVQFLVHWGEIIWAEPRVEFQRIGGHCIIAPNLPDKLGQWSCRYEGDYDFITSTLRWYQPHEVSWLAKVVAIARPMVNPMAQSVMVMH